MIAFVCHPYHRGGVTRWMVDMALAYAEKDEEVFFITVEPVKDFFSSGGKETIVSLLQHDSRVKLIAKKVDWRFEFGTELYRADAYKKMLLQHVPQDTPVILSDDFAAWRVSQLLTGYYNFIGVLHADEEVYYNFAKDYHSFINTWVCVSNRIKAKLPGYCDIDSNRVFVIPCGILLPVFNRKEIDSDILRLVYVGRIGEYQKRTSDLVRIGKNLSDEKINFQLEIIGDGEERELLARKFAEAGIAANVSFRGWLQKAEINTSLFSSDLLVLTSDFEGMPIAVMEALSTGCGIISTKVSGVEDLEFYPLALNCVWLNEVGDTGKAVENIKKAVCVPQLERATSAREIAEKEFSMDVCIERYDKVIAQSRHNKQPVNIQATGLLAIVYSTILSLMRYVRLKYIK